MLFSVCVKRPLAITENTLQQNIISIFYTFQCMKIFLFIIFHSLIYFAVLTYINELRRRIAFT